MAKLLWGRVEFYGRHVGRLSQEPGDRTAFTYEPGYLDRPEFGPVSHTLPLRAEPFVQEGGLLPYFDNLSAEGWLRNAQARALGVTRERRFELLLAFGRDCPGAVSVVDPAPEGEPQVQVGDPEEILALTGRTSISGVQPKVPVVRDGTGYRATTVKETSTHIAKLPSAAFSGIVELEYLTTLAMKALLPGDPIVEAELGTVKGIAERCFVVRRFDRTATGGKKHFEEFAQLLGVRSEDKYERAYGDMAKFIRETKGCIPAEAERLFRRLLASILVGNADTHLKNFGMFHTPDGLRLTPSYDLVATVHYNAGDMALAITKRTSLPLKALKAKDIVALGSEFDLNSKAVSLACEDLEKRLEGAKKSVAEAGVSKPFAEELTKLMEARWKGTFASIGKLLSKRPGGNAKPKA